jgi:hypothetical protein
MTHIRLITLSSQSLCRQANKSASMHPTVCNHMQSGLVDGEGVTLTLAVPAANLLNLCADYHPSANPNRPLLRTARPKKPGTAWQSRTMQQERLTRQQPPLASGRRSRVLPASAHQEQMPR